MVIHTAHEHTRRGRVRGSRRCRACVPFCHLCVACAMWTARPAVKPLLPQNMGVRSSVTGAHPARLEAQAMALVRQRQPHDTLRSADTANTEAWGHTKASG